MQLFSDQIRDNLIVNRKYLHGRSHYLKAFSRISTRLLLQEKRRQYYLKREDLTVPPIMIISVTNRCNLNCTGCYANAQDRDYNDEMDLKQIRYLVADAKAIGVGIIMLAGGEPLIREGLLDIIYDHPDLLFVMFTNGMLIKGDTLTRMEKMKNLVPAVSLEGNKSQTDERRGHGSYDRILDTMRVMDKKKMLFGTSITLTRENINQVLADSFLTDLEATGVRSLFLIEYVPCNGDADLCLTPSQKDYLLQRVEHIRSEYVMLPVALPGDESRFGGCLAAGRGFIHVSSTGAIEACPFAPYSDVNVKDMHLIDALRSPLLGYIRDNHHLLEETTGGCALYDNQSFIESFDEVAYSKQHKCFSLV